MLHFKITQNVILQEPLYVRRNDVSCKMIPAE